MTDHSIEQSLALTDDLRYDVVPRLSPRRHIPPADVLMALDVADDGFLQVSDLRAARDIVLRWLQERNYRFSGFQRDAFAMIARSAVSRAGSGGEAGIIIGAGTGAGKTDAFFFPTLLRIIADWLSGARGTKVICIYPRTRLAEDHLSNTYLRAIAQLRELGVQLSLGIDYGNIPYQRTQFNDDGSKRRIWMAGWERAGNRWRARFATCPFDRPNGGRCNAPLYVGPTVDWRRPVHACCDDHGEIEFLRLTRADLCADPPDILLVTTESLNDHLSDTTFVPLFGEPGLDPGRSLPPSIIMADEVHLHSGTKGVQIGYLLRRLVRRLHDADPEGNRRLTVIGLSATLAQPAAFFSDLTGVEQAQVEVVLPQAADRIRSGAEHIVFMRAQNVDRSQVLSTLIQAAMALLHVGVRPLPDQPERIFGFMNSLNVLHRWNLQMSDAEQRLQLWRLRLPSFVSGSRLIEEYAGPKPPCRDCEAAGHPDLGCPLYARGECWWPMATGGLRNPAGVALSYAGGSENIAPTDQLVITTSANEVGIDDPQLQAVMQYTAPLDVAGFVQRRGRMGRQQGARPTMVTVLSPWSNLDTFYFQNHALLLEPDFRPPPLNMDNRVARRIHTLYALMDRLAWIARTEGRSFSATGLTPQVLRQFIDWTSSGEAWPQFAAWLAEAVDAEVDDVIDLLRDGNDGVATRQLPLLARRAAERYMNDSRGYASRWGVSARDILPEFLPSRLFSELNLPELTLRTEGAPMPTETLQIEFGLREAMPGRVSYRRGAPYWIPIPRRPEVGKDLPRVEITEHYELLEQPEGDIPVSSIPARVRNRIPPGLLRDLTVYRPREARLVPFGGPALVNGRIRSVWRMLDDGRVDRSDAAEGSNANLLSDATNGSSIGFTRIRFDAELARPRFADTDSSKSHVQTLPGLFRSVTFGIADRELDRGHHPIDALVATVGADVSLRLAGKPEGHDGPVIFAQDGLAALGYRLETEGMQFSANLNTFHVRLADALNDDVLWTHLWWNMLRVRLMDTLAGLRVSDGFTIERFVDLTVSALSVAGFRPDDAARFDLASVLADFPRHLTAARDRFRPLRDSLFAPLVELAGRDEVRGEVSAAVQALLDDTTLESALEDVYVHSLEHALGKACRVAGGVESQSRLTGWAELRADVGTGTGRITVFELGTGGIGIMRAVQRAFAAHPELFWRVVSEQATTCEVHDGEAFTRAVLRLPESELVWLDDAVRELTFASDAVRAEQLQRDIASFMRRNLGTLMTPAQSRLLTRVFAEPLSTGAGDIASWRLYREINVTRWDALVAELGREPSTGEARYGIAWQVVCDAESGADGDTELVRLYRAMRPVGSPTSAGATADDGDNELAVEAGVAGLSRQIAQRLFASCTDVCVACLVDQSCTLADRQRSPLMLSRRLASAILRGSTPALLDARGRDWDTLVADLRSQLSAHGRVRVRYTASDAPAIDAGLLGLMDVSFIPSDAGQESFVRPVSAWFDLAGTRGARPVHELELEVWQHVDAGVAEPGIDPLALRRAASAWELFLFRELHLARFDETAELLIAVPQLNGPAAVDGDHDDVAGAGRVPQLAFTGFAQPRPHQPWTFEDVLGSLLRSRARLLLLLPQDAVDSDDLIERIDILAREAGSRLVVRFTGDPLSVGTIVGRDAVLRFSTDTLPSVSVDPDEVAEQKDQQSMLFARALTRAEAVRGAR